MKGLYLFGRMFRYVAYIVNEAVKTDKILNPLENQ